MSSTTQLFQLLFSTETKGDLLVLFHKNPGLIDTYDGVARRIGRVAKAIDTDVKDLVALGVLKTRQVGSREAIFLDRSKDKETQGALVEYLKTLRTPGGA